MDFTQKISSFSRVWCSPPTEKGCGRERALGGGFRLWCMLLRLDTSTTAASSGRFMQRRHRGGTTVSMSATEFGLVRKVRSRLRWRDPAGRLGSNLPQNCLADHARGPSTLSPSATCQDAVGLPDGLARLLDDPAELGVRLHSWSRHYSERLEQFCQNTALVGHVAVALLLSGRRREVALQSRRRRWRAWLKTSIANDKPVAGCKMPVVRASTVRMHDVQPRTGTAGKRSGKAPPGRDRSQASGQAETRSVESLCRATGPQAAAAHSSACLR